MSRAFPSALALCFQTFPLLVLAQSAPGPAAKPAPPPADLITVEVTLKAMSKLPKLKDLAPYAEALAAFEWEVNKVVKGALPDKTIIVYHWSFLERKPQAAAAWKIGEKQTLTLRPWDDVPELARLRRDEDLVVNRRNAPTFYDTALGAGLPAVLAKAETGGAMLEKVRKQLGGNLGQILCVNGADCHGLGGLDLLFGGGKGKAANLGGPGTGFGQVALGYRVAAAECPNLELAIQSGGADRPYGGFGGAGYPDALIILAGPPWPALPGRGPVPAISGDMDLVVLPGVGRGHVESLGTLQNCVREYGRRGKRFVLDLEFRNDGQYLRGGNNQAVHERFRSWGKVYPNFMYFHIYDPEAIRATVKAGLAVSAATIEKARVALAAQGSWKPKLIGWAADPADGRPDAAALARAVQAGGGGGEVVVGGAWIAKAMSGASSLAAFADAGVAEAELVLRSAIAAGKKPKQVVWGIEPLMLTAPKDEKPIGALPGPVWPVVGKPVNPGQGKGGATVIFLGHGTTVARGKGTWEYGLEYSLILEAALRELNRHQIGVVLVLAPNAAGIPEVAYEGLADRLRAYSLVFEGARFVEPGEIAGKADAAVRAAIQAHLADPRRGVLKSAVAVKGGW